MDLGCFYRKISYFQTKKKMDEKKQNKNVSLLFLLIFSEGPKGENKYKMSVYVLFQPE